MNWLSVFLTAFFYFLDNDMTKELSGSWLKIIAMLSMTIDHVAYYLFKNDFFEKALYYCNLEKDFFDLTEP